MHTYVIVSFFETPQKLTFHSREWPLHLTLLPRFTSDASEEILSSTLEDVATRHEPLHITPFERSSFGLQHTLSVTLVLPTTELRAIHEALAQHIETLGTLENPQYCHEGYRPHVTDQASGVIMPGESKRLQSISLVRIDETGMRTIITTRSFKN